MPKTAQMVLALPIAGKSTRDSFSQLMQSNMIRLTQCGWAVFSASGASATRKFT
jgi:hypothetical protein